MSIYEPLCPNCLKESGEDLAKCPYCGVKKSENISAERETLTHTMLAVILFAMQAVTNVILYFCRVNQTISLYGTEFLIMAFIMIVR